MKNNNNNIYNNMLNTYKIKKSIIQQAVIIDEVLLRYTNDEAGESQKEKYQEMTVEDKISLLTNTLLNCASYEDFETDVVINFDYNNY